MFQNHLLKRSYFLHWVTFLPLQMSFSVICVGLLLHCVLSSIDLCEYSSVDTTLSLWFANIFLRIFIYKFLRVLRFFFFYFFSLVLFSLIWVSRLSWPHSMRGKVFHPLLFSGGDCIKLLLFFFLPFKNNLSLKPQGSIIFSSGRTVPTTYIYLTDLFHLFNTFWWSAYSHVNFDSLCLSKKLIHFI